MSIKRMTEEQFVEVSRLAREKIQNHSQRFGQAMFNSLFQVRPDIANKIRNTEADPYYMDNNLPVFYVVLGEYMD